LANPPGGPFRRRIRITIMSCERSDHSLPAMIFAQRWPDDEVS
jgi:hypothetical protein